ncbi:10736_t:CDS:1, partial [Gigaspora margarita]
CWRAEGCAKHYNARLKTICPICNERTYSDTGICSTHGGIYDHAWRENKKTKMESIPLGSFNVINT